MTREVIRTLALLGLAGQAIVVVVVAAGAASLAGAAGPLGRIRRWLWGYELWAAFAVAVIATVGSLYLSERAGFVPCELCWFQRICMYPMTVLTLGAALRADHRAARYLLPLPVIGAAISVYHLLVENGVVEQARACQISAPGGCATKWIDEFGYITIPTLALTGFALVAAFLVFALAGSTDTDAA